MNCIWTYIYGFNFMKLADDSIISILNYITLNTYRVLRIK